MTPNSAYSLIAIVEGTDYTPTETTENVNGVSVINGKTPPIYGLLCTATNSSNTVIELLGNESGGGVTMPANTFVQGVVYYMYLKKLVTAGGASFVGLKYANHPLVY